MVIEASTHLPTAEAGSTPISKTVIMYRFLTGYRFAEYGNIRCSSSVINARQSVGDGS